MPAIMPLGSRATGAAGSILLPGRLPLSLLLLVLLSRRTDAFCAGNVFSLRAQADQQLPVCDEGRRAHIARAGLLAGAVVVGLPERSTAERGPGTVQRRVSSGQSMRNQVGVAGDVIHPASLLGLWQCERAVTGVEGNEEQAALVWQALGGDDRANTFGRNMVERFATRFITAPESIESAYVFEGESLNGVILDRRFEIQARLRDCSRVEWDARRPGSLSYERAAGKGSTELVVVERSAELPSGRGWGGSELYSITTAAGGLFGDSKVQKAARVQRRYRRAFDAQGNRIVEGIEICKTYRVLDGVAGVEMPTSTTKSMLRFTRPPQQQQSEQADEEEESAEDV